MLTSIKKRERDKEMWEEELNWNLEMRGKTCNIINGFST